MQYVERQIVKQWACNKIVQTPTCDSAFAFTEGVFWLPQRRSSLISELRRDGFLVRKVLVPHIKAEFAYARADSAYVKTDMR